LNKPMENELQDWQKEILERVDWNGLPMFGSELTFFLEDKQKEMIEKLLYPSDSNPFFVVERYANILKRVLLNGVYLESDKEALNYVRECYLKGKNFIK